VTSPISVLIIAYDGLQSLDLAGPLEVFTGVNIYLADCAREPAYQIAIASPGAKQVRTSSGLTLVPDTDLRAVRGVHTLLVPGGAGARSASGEVAGWLRQHAPMAQRITSVCTGAFLLAQAGLLAGRRATTHWAYADALERQFPDVIVDPEPIYVRDGNIVTSAGVTAGIDLALALVEEDVGREAALAVARHLVVFLRRPGGQAQFSAQLRAQAAQREPPGRIAGRPAAQAIQLMIEYDPQPPYNAGSLRSAPPDLVTSMRLQSRHTADELVAD